MVLTPKLFLNGARFTNEGCQEGAKRNVIPKVFIASTTFSEETFKGNPKFSNTSADPTLPLALRFPCLAIFTLKQLRQKQQQ